VERLYGVREEDDDAEKDVAATDGWPDDEMSLLLE
jgi:hypothetical protein